MKRSEMIDIIYNLNEIASRDAADFILKTIEEAGMSAPFCEKLWRSDMPNIYHGREWEEE